MKNTLLTFALVMLIGGTASAQVPQQSQVPGPVPAQATAARETHRLLYRLDQCLQRLAREYNRPPSTRPSLKELDSQIDEVEALLYQLRQRPLPQDRQIILFKTEMHIRTLRESVPNL